MRIKTGVWRNCMYCGKPFYRRPSKATPTARYCTTACRGLASRGRETLAAHVRTLMAWIDAQHGEGTAWKILRT